MFDVVDRPVDIKSRDVPAWVLSHLGQMERGEATWLAVLGRLDAEGLWARDGQLSCVEWLRLYGKLPRATAYEKVRVARELRRRPILVEAFGTGRIGYSAVRILTRLVDPDPDVDRALVDVAEAGTIGDLERIARTYEQYASQERRLADPSVGRRVALHTNPDGTGEIRIMLTALELEEARVALQVFVDKEREQSPRGDSSSRAVAAPSFSEQSPCGDSVDAGGLRADALMAMMRMAVAHAKDDGPPVGDRYLVHVVTTDGGPPALTDGTPVDESEVRTVACDAGIVAHRQTSDGEPLAVGRLHREWNTSQRRAARVRDGGHCRFPGCERRIVDLHHQLPWDDGGPTDIDNGLLMCRRHHRMLHKGFVALGNANHTVEFRRPDGRAIGSTCPVRQRMFMAVAP